MDKVLITGVAGFIGSRVAERFLDEGYVVVGVDDLSTGKEVNIPKGVDFIQADLSATSSLNLLPKDCRKILHLSGQSSGEISFDDPKLDLEKNTISTLNLIRYGIENQVERLVYASSMSVYGDVPNKPIPENFECNPLSCYGIGKKTSENYLNVYQNKLPFVSLRMFNVYGPGQDLSNLRQGMVSIYVAQALLKGQIEVKGSTDRFRDFIYIDDVIEAWFRAAIYPSALCKTINLGTGVKTTVRELLEQVCAFVPNSTYFVKGSTPGDQSGIYADISVLKTSLGLAKFTPLAEGLTKFISWARDTRPIIFNPLSTK